MNTPPNAVHAIPIFHKHYKLIIALNAAIARFPKHQRYILGGQLQEIALDIFKTILLANHERSFQRLKILKQLSLTLDLFKLLVRLSKDSGAMPEAAYVPLATSLVEIGRMLGGWINDTANPKKPSAG